MNYFKSISIRVPAVLLLSFLACCSSSNVNENNQRFGKYLNSEFDLSLPEEELEFLVVPGQGCAHSSNGLVDMFSEFSPTVDNLYLVVNQSFYTEDGSDINNQRLFVDRLGKIARLDLGYSSPMYILSKNKEIQSITEISINNLDSLKEVFKSRK